MLNLLPAGHWPPLAKRHRSQTELAPDLLDDLLGRLSRVDRQGIGWGLEGRELTLEQARSCEMIRPCGETLAKR